MEVNNPDAPEAVPIPRRKAVSVDSLSNEMPAHYINNAPDAKHPYWTEEEHEIFIAMVKAQREHPEADHDQPKYPSGKFWESISHQLRERGYNRSAKSCSLRWRGTGNHVSAKLIAGGGMNQADDVAPSTLSARPKRPLQGRDGFVDSGAITFAFGEPQVQVAKKPCRIPTPMLGPKKEDELNQLRTQHALPNTQAPAGAGTVNSITFGNSMEHPQTPVGLQSGGNNPISQHMADGDIDAIDHIIQGLKNAKTDLKSEIAAYEVSLAGIQNILKAKKLELERVDKKINANENGKEALLSIKRAYED